MIGRPSASTNGQYDGDGMWMWCGSSGSRRGGIVDAGLGASFTSRPSSSSVYLRCHHSSRCVTTGISAKLYSGGGDEVIHSSVRPSHGSSSQYSSLRNVAMTLTRNTSTDRAMMNAPIVDMRLSVSQPMPLGYV